MSQLEEFIAQLTETQKNLLDKEKLEKFIKTYGVKGIVGAGFLATQDKNIYAKSEQVIKQWIRHPKLFSFFLFSEDKEDQEVLQQLMLHQQSHVRAIAAECIDLHAYEISDVLLASQQHPLYNMYVKALTYLLSDEETEVAIKILRALTKMLKIKSGPVLMSDNIWLAEVKVGIENTNEVVALRYMELVVSMSNSSEQLHQKLQGTGVLEKAISIYKTDDILVKLNAVEIFGQFGEQEYNARYLAEQKITQQIIQEAFDPKEDLLVRKSAVLLVVKMIGAQAMKLTPQLSKDILAFVRKLILSSAQEEISSAFQIISFLSLQQQGIDLLVQDNKVLKTFIEFASSTKVELRKQCIISLTHITLTSPTNPKNKNLIVNLIMCIGNPSAISALDNLKEEPQNLERLEGWVKQLELNLFSPFEDIEIEYMQFLQNCLSYEILFEYFVRWARSVEYLGGHFCKNKLIFDLKQEIIEKITNIMKNSPKSEIRSIFFETLTKKRAEKQQVSQEMSYETTSL